MEQLESASNHRPSICIVACELAYLHRNGGIGTAHWLTAQNLARRGWNVHIIYTGQIDNEEAAHHAIKNLNQCGIGVTILRDLVWPEDLGRHPHEAYYAMLSERVHHALVPLHQKHRFDLIEFSECLAESFRPIQLRQAGLAYTDTRLMIKLHSSTLWVRELNQWSSREPIEMLYDYMERYSFDRADVQCSPCRYMFEYAAGNGWNVRSDAKVVPYFYPEPLPVEPIQEADDRPELVFFGRLETRKGLEVFVEATRPMTGVRFTFLGRTNRLANDEDSGDYLRREMAGRDYQIISHFNQEEAVRYLLSGRRLAVIPSLVDNQPNTVIECLVNRVPFIAARTGGIPEILDNFGIREPLLFDPTPNDLARCLKHCLELGTQAVNRNEEFSIDRHNDRIEREYRGFLTHPKQIAAEPRRTPMVTIALDTEGGTASEVRSALGAVASQSYPHIDVCITGPKCDLGWTNARLIQSEPTASLGRRREQAAREAQGEFFLVMSAKDLLDPKAVECLARMLAGREELSVVTSYVRYTNEYVKPYDRPTSAGRVYACLSNVFGTGPFMVRTADIQNGFIRLVDGEQTRTLHEIAVSSLKRIDSVDVVPQYLCTRRNRLPESSSTPGRPPLLQRLMSECVRDSSLPRSEQVAFWQLHVVERGEQEKSRKQLEFLEQQLMSWQTRLGSVRYRVVDAVHPVMKFVLPGPGRAAIRKTLLGLNKFRKAIRGKKAA